MPSPKSEDYRRFLVFLGAFLENTAGITEKENQRKKRKKNERVRATFLLETTRSSLLGICNSAYFRFFFFFSPLFVFLYPFPHHLDFSIAFPFYYFFSPESHGKGHRETRGTETKRLGRVCRRLADNGRTEDAFASPLPVRMGVSEKGNTFEGHIPDHYKSSKTLGGHLRRVGDCGAVWSSSSALFLFSGFATHSTSGFGGGRDHLYYYIYMFDFFFLFFL